MPGAKGYRVQPSRFQSEAAIPHPFL
ncbi:hypothetical protein CCACVL1_18993 [Corchorus capsularis]|uniref:Uncharacterized protein n=1 Tax=Corchorus capsularis TaxID=210143 RepID=A0A1R3HJ56_COCAP|nr:hypothetical protein CCACVL1_18993 [Corchorus capsularis]